MFRLPVKKIILYKLTFYMLQQQFKAVPVRQVLKKKPKKYQYLVAT